MSEPLTDDEIAWLKERAENIERFGRPDPNNQLHLRFLATIAHLRAELKVRDDQITRLLETNDKWVIQNTELRADKEQLQRSLDHMNDCCLRAEAERDQLREILNGLK